LIRSTPPHVAPLGLALVAFSMPIAAQAGRTLEPLVSPTDDRCTDYALGALSHDGRHLVITQNCHPVSSEGSEVRGALWRDFRSTSGLASRVVSPGFFSDLSADGRTAVGEVWPDATGWRSEAVILRDSGSTFGLGFLPDSSPWASSSATAMSSDGSTVAGGAQNASGEWVPFVWTPATGLQAIPPADPPPACEDDCEAPSGWAMGVTDDGSIVGNYDHRAFRWNAAHGTLPLLSDGSVEFHQLSAMDVSADGSTVAGTGWFDGELRPFVWSEPTGLIDLPLPPSNDGWRDDAPRSISWDGAVVVGGIRWGYPHWEPAFHEDRAFLWSRAKGLEDLRSALEDRGIDTWEWDSLDSAWAVSGDGSTILGWGGHASGGYVPTTFHASLLPAPQVGVDLCDLGDPGCHAVDIIARSGMTIRRDAGWSTVNRSRITSFSHAILNASGGVAFAAVNQYRPAGGEPDSGYSDLAIFAPDGTGRSRVCPVFPYSAPSLGISSGWQLSGSDDRDFALLDDGRVYFRATVDGRAGLWRCSLASNELWPSALVDDGLPDGSGDRIAQFWDKFQVDESGRVSFLAMLSPVGIPPSSWATSLVEAGPDGHRAVVLRAGETPPGIADRPYGGAYFHTRSASGRLALVGTLDSFGSHGTEQQDALWATGSDGELALVVRAGDLAPGYAGTKSFRSMLSSGGTPAINSAGEVAFTAVLGGDGSIESTVWTWSPAGALTRLASRTEPLPDLVPGRSIVAFDDPLINDRGDVLLSVILDYGPIHHHGFWLHTAEGARIPLLQTGRPAPGLPEGFVLGESIWNELPSYPDETDLAYATLTDGGDALLEFHLDGPGVDATNDRALFLVDRAGSATLVLRRGDRIAVAHEDVRTVDDFRVWYGYADGHARSPVNDRGEVVAILDFTDDTQAVAKVTVPEPGPGAMLFPAALALLAVRRARRGRPGSTTG